MDAFESREWDTAERVIVEIKDLLSKQVRLNPPDAVALNPFIEQADADLAEARRNKRSAPAPAAPPVRASHLRASLPGPERKAARHDWGATARAREKPFGSDDDDDDFCVVDPPSRVEALAPKNLGGPQRAVNRRGGSQRAGGSRAENAENAHVTARASPPRRAGFVSAGHRLDAENAEKGVGPAPRHNSNVGADRNGFVPPYVRKAFGPGSGGGGGGQTAKKNRAGGATRTSAARTRAATRSRGTGSCLRTCARRSRVPVPAAAKAGDRRRRNPDRTWVRVTGKAAPASRLRTSLPFARRPCGA